MGKGEPILVALYGRRSLPLLMPGSGAKNARCPVLKQFAVLSSRALALSQGGAVAAQVCDQGVRCRAKLSGCSSSPERCASRQRSTAVSAD